MAGQRTWSRDQLKLAREIGNHMTKDEKRQYSVFGMMFGIYFGAQAGTLGLLTLLVTAVLMGLVSAPVFLVGICISLAAILLARPSYQRYGDELFAMQREFLASTEWARQQGIRPEDLTRS